MARERAGADTIDYEQVDSVIDTLREETSGRGPDACIDAVGMEAHGHGLQYADDRARQAAMLETDRPIVLREAIMACRNGGTVSVPGVYGGCLDKIPFGALMNTALTLKTGQTHVQRYLRPLFERIERGEIDPSFIVTHRLPLEDAPLGYEIFKNKQDGCIKVVLKP
jgi:threonine dehydrogenase-like Zn-dependent dehydrogenase